MILNIDNWPNVTTLGNYDNHPNSAVTWHGYNDKMFTVRPYDDTDYWYINILDWDAFYHYPIEQLMPLEIIERVKRKEVVIIVCQASEAYHSVVFGIYQHLIKASKIPPSQVLLLSNSPDIATEIDYISSKLNIPPIRAEWIKTFEWDAMYYVNQVTNEPIGITSNTLNKTSYQKKFLSLNGQPRTHRIICMGLLCAYDLIPRGHVSYNNFVYGKKIEELPTGVEYYQNPMLSWASKHPEITKILTDNAEKISNLTSMFLDTTTEDQCSRGALQYAPTFYYEDTYFSLVTETLCLKLEGNGGRTGIGRILSEKIFKTIINRHPFILLGVPKSLELLRDLGYKTFSPWINEDYDTELDDLTRIHMVVKETKKLTELSDDQLAEFLIFAREIVEHNFNTLKAKVVYSHKSIPLPISSPLFLPPPLIDPSLDTPVIPSTQYKLCRPRIDANPFVKATSSLLHESTFTEPYTAYFATIGEFIIEWASEDYNKFAPDIIRHLQSDPSSILIMRWDWTPCYTDIFCNIIINFVQKNQLNPDQIYFIIMDYLQIPILDKYFSEANMKFHIAGRNQLLISETLEYNEPVVKPTKLFSVFSRSSREWRFHFFCDLIANGLLDKCIYSYINASPYISGEHPIEIADIKKMIPMTYGMIPDLNAKINDWVDGMPYAIEKDINLYYAHTLFDAINQSAIHIVIETMHIGETIHVTEKTWKAISVRKPFLIYGVLGCIDWLHQHGYKTFHPFINEEYDTIQDPILRKQAIISEMNRIAAMTESELDTLLQQCRPAIDHNHGLFLRERDFKWPEDFAKLNVFK